MRGLVAASTGQEPERVEPAWLRRATTADILARMSRNLRRCYTSLGEWDLALQAADRCVLLAPDAPAERRDRGLLLARLGRVSAARTDISAYLEAAPEDCADRGALSSTLARLRAMLN